jgi:hypothetical protein
MASALSEVLGIAARMRGAEQCWLLKAEWDGEFCTSRERCSGRGRHSELHTGIALCRPCAPHTLGPSQHLPVPKRVAHPFRVPLQFIVIAVMSVMSGTFPNIYGFST